MSMYWRGGVQQSTERSLVVLAGATLGGGSTINWQNCVRPPDRVRATWAKDYGLEGIDGSAFDDDLAAVAERIGISTQCCDRNGANQRLLDGAEKLGWSARVSSRNVDATRYSTESPGHVAFGDRSGAKLGSLRAWLPDAAADGARILVSARAERVLIEQGRAAGVSATIRIDGVQRPLEVRAPTVVVACGALETPALLLRSGIGGPAAGRFLRVHPAPAAFGLHAAAGAREVFDYSLPERVWKRGDDVERAIATVRNVPLGRGGRMPFCAHQMGSARMGRDPNTSVANPEGQLHDTAGVWIGDTSAFPTAVGANPMWTCMALARRTARAIAR